MFKEFKKALFLSFLLFTPFLSSAVNITENDIFLSVNPQAPRINQETTVKIESYLTDLNKASISWYVDDVLESKGIGLNEFKFITKPLGEDNKISVQVQTLEQGTVTLDINIFPAEVNILWQADSFIPKFYEGKALNSYQDTIRLVAFPTFINKNGQKIDPENLIYKWSKDFKVLGNISGYGKNYIELESPQIFKSYIVSVEVSSLEDNIKATRNIKVSSFAPEIVFYKEDPLLGLLTQKNLSGSITLQEDELNLLAYPLFFSNKSLGDGNAKLNWSMNGEGFQNDGYKVILRNDGGEGISKIGVNVKNLKELMQFSRNNLDIEFNQSGGFFGGSSSGSNFFGF